MGQAGQATAFPVFRIARADKVMGSMRLKMVTSYSLTTFGEPTGIEPAVRRSVIG